MPAPVRANSTNARSCAECRRLKHKCDKQVPCSACVSRGCQEICPEGTNPTGEGHRRFWARAAELKENLGRLARRVQDLEDALRSAHSLNSAADHPLLEERLLRVKDPFLSAEYVFRPEGSPNGTVEHPQATLGSLFVTQHGRVKYIGPGALLDVSSLLRKLDAMLIAFQNHTKDDADHCRANQSALQELPPDVPFPARMFPFAIFGTETCKTTMRERFATLRCYLPPPNEARRLINLHIKYCTRAVNYVPESEIDSAFQAVYEYSYATGRVDEPRTHQLHAIIYLVLASGALFDPDRPPCGVEAAKYYELGCYAIIGTRFLEAPTVEGIQALGLVARYKRECKVPQADDNINIEWAILGLINKTACTIGLHRDPEHFGLSPREQYRRRHLFWNIQVHETLASCNSSLPRNTLLAFSDTKLPDEVPTSARDISDAWKYKFLRDCMLPIQDEALSAKPLAYDRVLALDNKLRSYALPPLLQYQAPIPAEHAADVALIMWKRASFTIHIHCLTLQLHRPYWTIATREYAVDPMSSPYGPSVIIALRSASALLAIADTTYEYMIFPATRYNYANESINIGMTALASIVARCPALPAAADALRQIEHTHAVAAKNWGVHGDGFGILKRMGALRDLARAVHTAHAAPAGAQVFRPSAEQIEAVLAAPASSDHDGSDYFTANTTTVCGPLPGEGLEWPSTYVDLHVLGSWRSSGSEGSDR